MSLKTLQRIGWQITKWLVILSVFYTISVLLGVRAILPEHRVLVRTTRTDLTVVSLACDVVCLLLTAVFLRGQLSGVSAVDTTTVLTTAASLVAFMSTTVFLMCEAALGHFLCAFLQTGIDPVHPLVLKASFFYLTLSMYLFFSEMARLRGTRAAVGVVASLVVLWAVAVSAVSWCFLYLGLHHSFTQEDTIVDVRKVDYSPLLVVSFLLFLLFDSGGRNRRNWTVRDTAAASIVLQI